MMSRTVRSPWNCPHYLDCSGHWARLPLTTSLWSAADVHRIRCIGMWSPGLLQDACCPRWFWFAAVLLSDRKREREKVVSVIWSGKETHKYSKSRSWIYFQIEHSVWVSLNLTECSVKSQVLWSKRSWEIIKTHTQTLNDRQGFVQFILPS